MPQRVLLVTGFGPFLDIADNPSGRLARSLHGQVAGDLRLVGRELRVSYEHAVSETVSTARAHHAVAVVGFGVAAGSPGVRVERRAVGSGDGITPDALSVVRGSLGPDAERYSPSASALAKALGAPLSDDAGQYVCNAWLYGVLGALTVPVCFVHLPSEGADPGVMLAGLARWLG